MEVSSVSSSSYTPPPQAQTQRAERPEASEQKVAAKKEDQPERSEERKPAPVVNTQGQTTGRIVNTSA
jgi:hypothetical protein